MVGDQQLRVAFISNESFPTWMSTTNRILSLAKGLVLNGNTNVDIYCVRPTEKRKNPNNTERSGNINEWIYFQYTNKSIIWPNSILKKILVTIIGVLKFVYIFIRSHKKQPYDAMINTMSDLFPAILLRMVCSLMGIKFILTADEFPRVVRYPENYSKLFSVFYLKTFYKLYDGMIIMTTPLIDYFKNGYIRQNCKIIHIPMTVEPERFDIKPYEKGEFHYIAYCGNLGQNNKDGLPILFRSFAQIEKKHPYYRLYIIGDAIASQQNQLKKLKTLVAELGIADKVVFTGKVHRDKIPEYLCNADILALSRPNNLQAQGGFPTKLGEYLSTGNPVVVTTVGEIPRYLTHKKNVFFSEPDSVEAFSEQLDYVIGHYEFAKQVGTEGKKVAYSVFNYSYQGKNLFTYLIELNTSEK